LPANAALNAGARAFSLTNKTAGTWTLTATDISDRNQIAVHQFADYCDAGAVTKLQILLPGETAAPGTGTGKRNPFRSIAGIP